MRKRAFLIILLIAALVMTACAGEAPATPSPTPVPERVTPSPAPAQERLTPPPTSTAVTVAGLEILEVTFAHGLTEELAPVQPGNTFAPDETVHLSIKLKGTPKQGQVTARFFFEEQEISAATVDLAEERKKQGLLFVIGGNTYVGFSLTPDEPFPISDNYRAEIFLDGSPAGSYTFTVVSPPGAIPSRVLEATLARDVTEDFLPVEPADRFAPTDEVFLVGRVDLGVFSTLEVNWYVTGRLDEEGTRTITAQENIEDTGFYFSFLPEQGWPEGEHQVVLLLDGREVRTYTFTVSEAAAEARPVMREERSVDINALYYATDVTGKAIGGVSPVRITVRPAAQPGELRVGFFEEEVAGTGEMWRAAGWMAVLVASQVLGIDPRDFEFSFSVGGRIDGPSAGTYMTVGVLAALLGDSLRGDVAMTGTINPDGTIGPVGGIPQKIQGAAAAGARLVLVPAGQRYAYDVNRQQLVDVVEVGKDLGVDVQEVSTLFEAYELLTDHPLPRPEVTAGTPQLPSRAFDRVRAKAREWYARYQDARSRLDSLMPEITAFFAEGIADADETARKADSALQQGLAAVAYQRAFEAAVQTQLWLLVSEIIQRYAESGLGAAVDYLVATQAAVGEVNAVLDLLATERPRTAGDYVALFDAYTSIGQAQGVILVAESRLSELKQRAAEMSEEEILGELAQVATYYVLARNVVQVARDSVDIGFGYGQVEVADLQRVEAMAELLRRATEANVTYFEVTVVDEYARQLGVHPDRMRQIFLTTDVQYLLTVASRQGVQALTARIADSAQRNRLVLGNNMGNFALSASLVAKHYSLGAELDAKGNVTGVTRERALADMLDLADQRARELIALNGEEVPVMAILLYEIARLQRQGDITEQIDALQTYWQAATLAQVQAYLAGITGR